MAKQKSAQICGCMPAMGILALVLSVVGIYALVLGIKTQWVSPLVYSNWVSMGYYLVGIIAMALAKLSKHYAYDKCEMHRM